jgi:protein-disulfide isomerase
MEDTTPKPKKGTGCAVFGWTIFSCMLLFLTFFGYKVWYYAKQIRSGNLVNLPQFQQQFTAVSAAVSSTDFAAREIVEAGNQPELGNKNAVLTIVEFADFECPYSKEESNVVRRLMARHGDKVRFIYRDLPIASLHPNSATTSLAAECANEQGKFWQMHDKLYAATPPFTFVTLKSMAAEVGLDVTQFERCMVENRYGSEIAADIQTANALGLRGTPTFFINGQRIEGAIPEEVLEKIIERYTE